MILEKFQDTLSAKTTGEVEEYNQPFLVTEKPCQMAFFLKKDDFIGQVS